MPLAIDKVRQCAAVRIASLPSNHAQKASTRYIKRHFSPLHDLMNTFKLNPKTMEKKLEVRKEAGWQSGIRIREWIDKEDALKQIEEDDAKYQLYTDGSGIDGFVGASAVLYKGDNEIAVLCYHLGRESDHEVFEAECVGPMLGLELLK